MNFVYYPQQSHDLYGYRKKHFTPSSVLDIGRLTIHQLNDLHPRSSFFLKYEQQPYSMYSPKLLYVPFGSQHDIEYMLLKLTIR